MNAAGFNDPGEVLLRSPKLDDRSMIVMCGAMIYYGCIAHASLEETGPHGYAVGSGWKKDRYNVGQDELVT